MMKLLIINLFVFYSILSFGQNDTIKASLLLDKLNKSSNLYKTIYEIQVNPIDLVDCYYNDDLKSLLLPLLSREKIFEQQYKLGWSDEYTKSSILLYLKERNLNNIYDSIVNDPYLYSVYTDSVKLQFINQLASEYNKKTWIPNGLLKLVTNIKWSESYSILYNIWVADEKKITSIVFKPLLSFHCPEAIQKYNSLIDKAIQLQKIDFLLKVWRDALNYQKYGSYCLDLYIRLLHCDTFYYFNDEEAENDTTLCKIPFNYAILSPFLNPKEEYITSENYEFAHLKDSIFDRSYKKIKYDDYSYSQISTQIIQFIDYFEKQVQPKKQLIEKNEFYWKQNMPYYKKEVIEHEEK